MASEEKPQGPRENVNRLNWGSIIRDSFRRLNPGVLYKNPVMFIVEITFYIVAIMAIDPTLIPNVSSAAERGFYITVAIILIITVWFSTLSDSIAEAQIRNTASTLRKIEKEVPARKVVSADGRDYMEVTSKQLKKGDIIKIDKGERVPIDSEVLEGIAMVDESLLTGESIDVRKSVGSTLLGGSVVTTDSLVARVSVDPNETFLSKLIKLVESSERPKTPNEVAVSVLLAGFTAIFTIIILSILLLGVSLNLGVDLSVLIALYVSLLPTTIGALLPAIGISGINRMSANRVIIKSGKAIEAAGDTDSLLLDKTGTITKGFRTAVEFIPLGKRSERDVGESAFMSSWNDDTPEGKSIVELAYSKGYVPHEFAIIDRAKYQEFSASTRKSGISIDDANDFVLPKGGKGILQRRRVRRKYSHEDSSDEIEIVKGAPDAIKSVSANPPLNYDSIVENASKSGDTVMAIAEGDEIIGLIKLKDEVKPGIREKIRAIKDLGIKTVMITGDQPVTAETISKEVGIDEVVSRAKPETKFEMVKKEQASGRIVAMIGDGTNDAPALAAADVGMAMASGTEPAKEAANMVDLESNPAKIIDVVMMGKQILMTRGAVTTFSISNDIAKYFVIVPVMFAALPALSGLNILDLSPHVAVISALIFNALVIPALIPLALRGAEFRPQSTMRIFIKNVMIFGMGGVILPFIGIKAIAIIITFLGGVL